MTIENYGKSPKYLGNEDGGTVTTSFSLHPSLLEEFQQAVEEDPRTNSQSMVLRDLIRRYIEERGGRDG